MDAVQKGDFDQKSSERFFASDGLYDRFKDGSNRLTDREGTNKEYDPKELIKT